jgi:D-alanyl-D-alanine carboxypeptidase
VKNSSRTRSHSPSPIAAVAAAVAALAIGACDDETTTPPPNVAVETQLQQVLDGSVAKPDVVLPGATVYYHNPAYRPWSGAAGLGEVPGQVAMRARDHFRAGSVLKTFLATVAMQHVEAGTLALDQTLPSLVPEAVTVRIAGADQITLRMLLNHTSGIPDWVNEQTHALIVADPAHVWSTDEIMDIVAALPPTFAPGTSYGYSNTDYNLVGIAIERAAGGKSWRAQVRERLFDRVGLANTRLPEPGDVSVGADFAHGYQLIESGMIDLSAVDPSMAGAAGGHALVTTGEDLGKFIEALLAGALFTKPATLAAMMPSLEVPHVSGLPYRYGFALEEFVMPNGSVVVGHSGSTAGYSMMMFRIPANDTTLVTAVNTNDLFTNALEVFIPAVEAIAVAQ